MPSGATTLRENHSLKYQIEFKNFRLERRPWENIRSEFASAMFSGDLIFDELIVMKVHMVFGKADADRALAACARLLSHP
jgi:hypothetical protein